MHTAHLIVAFNKVCILFTRIQVLVCWHLFVMISKVECQNLQTKEGECLPFVVQGHHRIYCQGSSCKQFAKFGSMNRNHHSLINPLSVLECMVLMALFLF